MEKLPISIVIPTMNRPKDLHETLESYMGAQWIPGQIIVVDQSEKKSVQDQNRSILERYKNKTEYIYIYQKEPSSTKARNIGFQKCKYDLVCYSDDDVTIKNDTLLWIDKLMKQQDIAMIAGLNENAGNGDSFLGYLFGRKSYQKRKYGHVTKAMFGRFPSEEVTKEVKTEWAMGFFFVIRKSYALKWHSMWDENLTSYAYAEDLDYSYSYNKKAVEEAKRSIIHPNISVIHRASSEWRIPTKRSTMMFILNREYLSYKHKMGIFSRIAMRWANFGEILFRIVNKSDWKTVIYAQYLCDKKRKDIRKGLLLGEWYEK